MTRQELRNIIEEAYYELLAAKGLAEAEGDEEVPAEETPEEEVPAEELTPEAPEEPADPTVDILEKFPTLKKTLTHLLTADFDQFVEKIGWMSPKPTTFKVEFKNGQDLSLKWLGKGFEATVEGKRYSLNNVAEYQQCLDKIGAMLASGPIQTGFEAESPEFGGEGGGGVFPGEEGGEAAPGAEPGTEAGAEAGAEAPAAGGGGEDVFAGL